jgi:hypothetical protein
MQTVVETPSYLADAERLFSPQERLAIVNRLATDPACGRVIPGAGGIRKVRFGFGGRGRAAVRELSTFSAAKACPCSFLRCSLKTKKPIFLVPSAVH